MSKKVASAVSIIGGADGPTSVFLLGGKGAKRTLKQKIQRKLFLLRKQCIAGRLKADPHTMEQVIERAKSKWGYRDSGKNTKEYKREYREMRRHHREFRDIYRYYGVTQADIDNRTKRYEELLRTLAGR